MPVYRARGVRAGLVATPGSTPEDAPVAVGTFTWRGKTTPIAIRHHQDGLLLQRLYFAGEVHNAAEINRGGDPKIRDQERTLAERLISELSEPSSSPRSTRTSTGRVS
jgi:non-homologous end joining protein Ku